MTLRKIPRRSIQVAALALALVLVFAGCMSEGQTAVQNEMNADRKASRLSSLPTHDQLNAKAQAWAEKIARDGKLSHSNLSSGVPSCWRSLGENVGYGGSAASVQDAYMRSSGHRANILSSKWKYVGVGFAKAGNRVYTVQVFMQGC
ncbi:MAG TPA: CAP domain-containing protein [Iamia sp.]|nr:CAP domain-containing protein [Iamia sp.]